MKYLSLSSFVLASCTASIDKVIDTSVVEQDVVDLDGDGYDSTEDCDDFSATTNPELLNFVMALITIPMVRLMRGS